MWCGRIVLASVYVGKSVVVLAGPVHPVAHPLVVPLAAPLRLPMIARDSISHRTLDAAPDGATRWSSGFAYAKHGIFVRVALDGIDVGWFLLDTGANATVVDDRVASQRHLLPAGYELVEGAGSRLRARVYRLGNVSVNSATAFAVTGVAQDLTGFPAPEGESLAGILGSDFLDSFVVTIDFVAHRATFSLQSDSTMPPRTRVQFSTDHGAPCIPVTLDDHVVAHFRIDTGLYGSYDDTPYLTVGNDVWTELSRGHSTQTRTGHVSARGIGDDQAVTLPAVRIDQLAISAARITSAWVAPQQRRGFANDAVNLLGNGVLERFSPVTIDYRTGMLYLTIAQ